MLFIRFNQGILLDHNAMPVIFSGKFAQLVRLVRIEILLKTKMETNNILS